MEYAKFIFRAFHDRSRPRSGRHDRHRARLHLEIRGRLLRQRGYRNLLHALHLLPVDQECQDRGHLLVNPLRCGLLLHGKCKGNRYLKFD